MLMETIKTYVLKLCGVGAFNVAERRVRFNNSIRDKVAHLYVLHVSRFTRIRQQGPEG
jgi:hypothetical protein